MGILSKQVSDIYGGISTVNPVDRPQNTFSDLVNVVSDETYGVHTRNGIKLLTAVSGADDNTKYHQVDKDTLIAIMPNGTLKVVNRTTGAVSFTSVQEYLKTSSPKEDIQLVSVGKDTVILNKNVPPQLTVAPYLSTDRVQVMFNFGEGELSEPITVPENDAYYSVYCPDTWTTSGTNKFVPVPAEATASYPNWGQSHSLADAYMAWKSYFVSHFLPTAPTSDRYTILAEPDFTNITIDSSEDNPPWATYEGAEGGAWNDEYNGIPVNYQGFFTVRATEHSTGNTYDMTLRVIVKVAKYPVRASLAGTLENSREYVGWPKANSSSKFRPPGSIYRVHTVPAFEGNIIVKVDDHTYSHGYVNGWSAEEYTQYFYDQMVATLDSAKYTIAKDPSGWGISITGAQGVLVRCSAYSDEGYDNIVNCVYSDLPLQESVFVVIKTGLPETTYSLSLDGHLVTLTTGTTEHPDTYKIDTIANNFASQVNALGPYSAAIYGNFIRIIRGDKVPMTFAFHDSYGDQAMYVLKNRVQSVADLPTRFIPGVPIQVIDGTKAEDLGYYVHYTLKDVKPPKAYGFEQQSNQSVTNLLGHIQPAGSSWSATEGSETGAWQECANPRDPSIFFPDTLPLVLKKDDKGNYTIDHAVFSPRGCGDKDSVPAPYFTGKKINHMFFYRNRLGFLTDNSIDLSRSGQFFNFFPTSAKASIADDSISLQPNHNKNSKLFYTCPVGGTLIVYGDAAQLAINSVGALTPESINCQTVSEYEVNIATKPIVFNKFSAFINNKEVYLYQIESSLNMQTSAAKLTEACPLLIKDPGLMVVNGRNTVLAILDNTDRNVVYVFNKGFSKFVIDATITDIFFHEEDLYVVDDTGRIGSIDHIARYFTEGLTFRVCLDWYKDLMPVAGIYPIAYSEDLRAYDLTTGYKLVINEESTGVSVNSTGKVRFGKEFTSRVVFNRQYARDTKGAVIAGTNVRYNIVNVDLQYKDTPNIQASCTISGRPVRTSTIVKEGILSLDGIKSKTGVLKVTCLHDNPTITITNIGAYPINLEGYSVTADLTSLTRMI